MEGHGGFPRSTQRRSAAKLLDVTGGSGRLQVFLAEGSLLFVDRLVPVIVTIPLPSSFVSLRGLLPFLAPKFRL
jgi:hypothetical protein